MGDTITTIRSNRIYKRDLPEEKLKTIDALTDEFASVKHYAHKTYAEGLRHPEKETNSLYLTVSRRFPDVSVYIIHTALREAQGAQKACAELQKHHTEVCREKLSGAQKKLNAKEKYLKKLLTVKQRCIDGKLSFDKRQTTFKLNPNGSIEIRKKGRIVNTFADAYQFEVLWLNPEIKHVRQNIGAIRFKVNRLTDKIEKYKTYVPAVQFGTKKLRRQGVGDKDKQQMYLLQRKRIFTVSGRNDSQDGNFVFRYDTEKHLLSVVLNKKVIVTLNTVFPYGQELIDSYYPEQYEVVHKGGKGKPITFYLEDNGKYYTVKCVLSIERETVNFSKSDGVIGVDTNLGFFSLCETDADGNPLFFADYGYEWKGRTSGQTQCNIRNAVAKLVDTAVRTHKPLVVELLKFRAGKKLKDYNSSSLKNFNSNMFAYNKMLEALKLRAARCGVEVYTVKPEYTSLIGYTKFMPYYKRSVHQMAALTIARRSLNKSESIPSRFEEANWSEVCKFVKRVS